MTLTDEEAREILTALQRSADMLEAGGARIPNFVETDQWVNQSRRRCSHDQTQAG